MAAMMPPERPFLPIAPTGAETGPSLLSFAAGTVSNGVPGVAREGLATRKEAVERCLLVVGYAVPLTLTSRFGQRCNRGRQLNV